MLYLYNILTHIAGFHLKLIALFNRKLKWGVDGRSRTFEQLRSSVFENDKVIWFHCASLGEYEQGLPVFEEIKQLYQNHKIVLSFFSPSGYMVRKNAPIADVVVYLPLDTSKNARTFIDIVHPELVIFVKYEIWPNYLLEINKRQIRAILISALFRKDQSYFKTQGAWMRKSIEAFEHIFVQNKTSKELLNQYGFNNVTISGDTRYDRVLSQLEQDNSMAFLDEFKSGKICLVAGSTWPEGEEILTHYINNSNKDHKVIIAPHNIKEKQIANLKSKIRKKTILYSRMEGEDLKNYQVLILDTIGLLSKAYYYADLAYVGGAMGTTGLHNILEPAVFGVPILIGPNYEKFPEAFSMLNQAGVHSIKNQKEFNALIDSFIENSEKRDFEGIKNASFIKKNGGAVIQIMSFFRN